MIPEFQELRYHIHGNYTRYPYFTQILKLVGAGALTITTSIRSPINTWSVIYVASVNDNMVLMWYSKYILQISTHICPSTVWYSPIPHKFYLSPNQSVYIPLIWALRTSAPISKPFPGTNYSTSGIWYPWHLPDTIFPRHHYFSTPDTTFPPTIH